MSANASIVQRAALCVALALCTCAASAQSKAQAEAPAPALTLQEAERIALRNRPTLRAKQYSAEGARLVRLQAEAARYPQISGNVTTATARRDTVTQNGREVTLDTRIAAGGLNNPTVLRRDAAGIAVSQLITDFGRTTRLVESAELGERSQQAQLNATRARVELDVVTAYFAVLEAQSVLRVAQKTVDARQVLLDRVAALMKSKLKSELDLRFAQVTLDEAKLLQLRAGQSLDTAFAHLATALGSHDVHRYTLAEQPDAPPMPAFDQLVRQALAARPELVSLRADRDAASKFADAQGALRYPTVSAFAVGGVVPVGDERLPGTYAAIGINLNMTLFDGGKISALQQEARARAMSATENLAESENAIADAVRVAWLDADVAREHIVIADHLRDAAAQALRLAETRYGLGITSIVELNQAQLAALDAEVGHARARYGYLRARIVLDYQIGSLSTTADQQ